MKSHVLVSVFLTALLLQTVSAEARKGPILSARKKPHLAASSAPVSVAKKSPAVQVQKLKPVTVSVPIPKPDGAKKPSLLKAIFSRKSAPVPAPVVAVILPKTSPPVKKAPREKRGPVIRPDPGEFLDISFPAPKAKKPAVASAGTVRR